MELVKNKKMKLTKLQRHTAYILMLAESKGHYTDHGFCYMVMQLFDIHIYDYNLLGHPLHVDFNLLLPELHNKKPIGVTGNYWFSRYDPSGGWKQRRELLKQCIKETA